QHYKDKYLSMYCRDKYNKYDYSHIAVKLLDITAKEKQDYFDSEKSRLEVMTTGKGGATGKGGRTFFVINNPDIIIKTGLALLNSKQVGRKKFVNMILGLMCLTGRRATEVLLMTVGIATLTPVKKRSELMLFHGQLKNEQAANPVDDYCIYVLANNVLIANKIRELRQMVSDGWGLPILKKLDFSEYDNDEFTKLNINVSLHHAWGHRKEGREKGNVLGLAAKNARFGNYLSVAEGGDIDDAIPTNPDDFKAKQLRAIYVLLAYKHFVYDKKESQDLGNFGFQLLGHTKAGAVDHYTNYRIKGVPIGR
ncbi:MAG: protelomerase family protein, partial [Candidatus Parabeggiatoa sp.]|nr:protelomerase family protein [Candidatus Parabeggiatoa sp.]